MSSYTDNRNQRKLQRFAVKEFITDNRPWFDNKVLRDAFKLHLAALARKCKTLTIDTFRDSTKSFSKVTVGAVGGSLCLMSYGGMGPTTLVVFSGRDKVVNKIWQSDMRPSDFDMEQLIALSFKILTNQIENAIFVDRIERIL